GGFHVSYDLVPVQPQKVVSIALDLVLEGCLHLLLKVLRRSLRSTLFPYTTLFRSQRTRAACALGTESRPARAACTGSRRSRGTRSEEHTSELQSRENLVCRLLLENKKATKLNAR